MSPTNGQVQQLPPPLYSNPSFNTSGQDFDINSFLNSDYFANAGVANNGLDFGNSNNDFDFGLDAAMGTGNNFVTPGGGGDTTTTTGNVMSKTDDDDNLASLFGANADDFEEEEEDVEDINSPQTINTDDYNKNNTTTNTNTKPPYTSRPGAVLGSVTGGSNSAQSSPMPLPPTPPAVEIEDVRDEEEGSARKRVRRS